MGQWKLPGAATRSGANLRKQAERLLSRVTRPLIEHGIPYAAYLRSGGVVFSILDAAEELECQQIVVPPPHTGLRRLFSQDVVATLYARQRDIPVIAVADDGVPLRAAPLGK